MILWGEGDVIRKLRQAVGWDLNELASASGVDPQTIHRIEKGTTKEPKRQTLRKIVKAFGLSIRELEDAVPRDHPGVPLRIGMVPERLTTPEPATAGHADSGVSPIKGNAGGK